MLDILNFLRFTVTDCVRERVCELRLCVFCVCCCCLWLVFFCRKTASSLFLSVFDLFFAVAAAVAEGAFERRRWLHVMLVRVFLLSFSASGSASFVSQAVGECQAATPNENKQAIFSARNVPTADSAFNYRLSAKPACCLYAGQTLVWLTATDPPFLYSLSN